MPETEATKAPVDRKKRIKRLKKIILATIALMIVVPTVLSIVLGIYLHSYKRAVRELEDQINHFLETESENTYVMEELESNAEEIPETVEEAVEPAPDLAPTVPVISDTPLQPSDIASLELTDEELFEGYRKVYLTFDDGPSANTDDILDILAKYNVKATFFVIRKDGASNEKLYRRIVDEGHSLGMHSTNHVYSDVYESLEAFSEDTKKLREFLYMVTGVETNLYRFPGGSSNHVSRVDMAVFAGYLNDIGIQYFDWNVSSGDSAYPRPEAKDIISNISTKLTKYKEVMILMHDTASRDTTVEALPKIIETILAMDNTVILPITEGTKPVQHLTLGR